MKRRYMRKKCSNCYFYETCELAINGKLCACKGYYAAELEKNIGKKAYCRSCISFGKCKNCGDGNHEACELYCPVDIEWRLMRGGNADEAVHGCNE